MKERINRLFALYNYENLKHTKDYAIFLLKQGMYFGAEILIYNENYDISTEKRDLQDMGYACNIHVFTTIESVEQYLFDGFFQVKIANRKIENRYGEFTSKLMEPYEDSEMKYQYVNVSYSNTDSFERSERNIIDEVGSYFSKKGAYLIIIEAAAGFGKTCTAYELYHSFIARNDSVKPLFAELSRSRDVKQFKYVLWSEIDNEYGYASFGTELVEHNIRKGNIPLIIDGFDELLSKDINPITKKKENDFEQVETMLSTIGALLEDNAKIILTSRRTAIFSGDEFYNWLDSFDNKFQCIRYQLEKPKIDDWLTPDRVKSIEDNKVPILHLGNPVLLTYLKHINDKEFYDIVKNPDSLTDKYFDFLLKREQHRQALAISPEDQMTIFKKLAREFALYDVTSESRSYVKELIIDDNRELLLKSKQYTTSKASTVELADILTNHALIDRVGTSGKVGFVNQFVFGTLLGYVLIEEPELFEDDVENIPEGIVEIVVDAFAFHVESKRTLLWEALKRYKPIMSVNLQMLLDVTLVKCLYGDYASHTFHSMSFIGTKIHKNNCKLTNCVFTDCIFEDCTFDPQVLHSASFIGCIFKACKSTKNNTEYEIRCYGCNDYGNDFINQIQTEKETTIVDDGHDDNYYTLEILKRYFRVNNRTTKMKTISSLKEEFKHENAEKIFSIFHTLTKNRLIHTNGNNSYITKTGINLYVKLSH